jgi:membrane protein implicated in regulation of membrane protease activity
VSLDLGAPALEVAIGLSFVFFLLSLVVTWITETFSRIRKQRAKTLKQGFEGLLGDVEIAKKIFNHPLVQSDVNSPEGKKDPSYVSSRNFSLALVSLLKSSGESSASGGSELAAVEAGVDAVDGEIESGTDRSPLAKQLDALLEEVGAQGTLDDFRRSAEKWFDDAMDRVSGWYTRWAKVVNLVVALLIAISLNASAVRITERLIEEPSVRAAVATGAQGVVEREKEAPKATGEAAQRAVKELESLQLPILWSQENLPVHNPTFSWDSLREFLPTLAGWLITAIAISLGAPFWFDALGKLARLRSAGKKPEGEGQEAVAPAPQTVRLEVSQAPSPAPPPAGEP